MAVCAAKTKAGTPCRAPASTDGFCGAHGPNYRPPGKRTHAERLRLTEQAQVMRAEGHTYEVIGGVLGITAFAAAIYAPEEPERMKSLPSEDRKRARSELVKRIKDEIDGAVAEEGETNRSAALQELELCERLGVVPSWYPASERTAAPLPDEIQEQVDALAQEQEKDAYWATARNKRRSWLGSLDERITAKDPHHELGTPTKIETLPSKSNPDPFIVVAGESERHLEEIIGPLDLDDLEALPDSTLERLRARVLEAGLAPPSVQRAERERLALAEPHRGHAPVAAKAAMTGGRGRTRKQQSESHKSRGKKFKRRQKQPRDGWGALAHG